MSVTTKSTQEAVSSLCIVATDIVRSMVEHPGHVSVAMVESDSAQMIMLLTVHPDDLIGVFGQEGRILRALRTFMYAAAAKNHVSLQLQIEATRPPPRRNTPTHP